MGSPDRKSKRLLTAEQKYDLWVRMLAGQVTQAEAAVEAGVDRSVISRLRAVARDDAIAAVGCRNFGSTTDPGIGCISNSRARCWSCCSGAAPSVGRIAISNVRASWQKTSSRRED